MKIYFLKFLSRVLCITQKNTSTVKISHRLASVSYLRRGREASLNISLKCLTFKYIQKIFQHLIDFLIPGPHEVQGTIQLE